MAKAVENIISRGQIPEGERNYRRHDSTIKDTITKFALTHGTAAAVELSTLVNGPSRSTIMKECRATHPVLGWVDGDNVKEHVLTAQSEYCCILCFISLPYSINRYFYFHVALIFSYDLNIRFRSQSFFLNLNHLIYGQNKCHVYLLKMKL